MFKEIFEVLIFLVSVNYLLNRFFLLRGRGQTTYNMANYWYEHKHI